MKSPWFNREERWYRLRRYLPKRWLAKAPPAVIVRWAFDDEYERFASLCGGDRPQTRPDRRQTLPMMNDRTADTPYDRHYLYHTAWASRRLAEIRPTYHVDIGSYLYFVAIASATTPIRFYDYRPARVDLPGVVTGSADILSLPFATHSVKSLSCLHVIEHIGLGRYGDPMDANGDIKALAELSRVLAPGGSLLLAAPVGRPSVIFNAHRIYTPSQIVEMLPGLTLHEFSLIPEAPADGGLVLNPSEELIAKQEYGCGCFWFKRPL